MSSDQEPRGFFISESNYMYVCMCVCACEGVLPQGDKKLCVSYLELQAGSNLILCLRYLAQSTE